MASPQILNLPLIDLTATIPIRLLYFLCVAGVFIAPSAYSTDDYFSSIEWSLRKDKHGIQVYTGQVAESKHLAVYSTVELQANVNSVVALLLDLPNCRDWASTCKEARVERQISPTESIVYGVNDLPFPVNNRDSYSRVSWFFDVESGVVGMDSQALPESDYPCHRGLTRVSQAQVSWRVVPTENGNAIVENYLHANPNGQIPVWLINRLIIDSPFKALRKMRRLLKSGKYDGKTVDFLHTM